MKYSIILASIMYIALPINAHSAGGGDGDTIVATCKKGKVWDTKKKECVTLEQESQLDDDNLYEVARDLAYNERYEEVLEVLQFATNSEDPRILNYLGYATRKLGEPEESLEYYLAALEIDPDYHLAREYMGEAFLQMGMIKKAEKELKELETRCGTDCPEYEMLAEEIRKAINSG